VESTRQQSPIQLPEDDDLAQDLAQLSTKEIVTVPKPSTSSTYVPVTTFPLLPLTNTHTNIGQQGQKELNISASTLFTGKKEQITQWLIAVRLYLEANNHVYISDKLQIFYALSRISDNGETKIWKENWQTTKMAPNAYRTFTAFCNEFKNAFTSVTSMDDAMRKLKV